ncbi:MAG: glycosyltransferase family 2 protein [Candidatus Rokubacteria bacterium]|nr:glycosyltransferase family 2 protein [Candidatus Rokubacteria bacterium]
MVDTVAALVFWLSAALLAYGYVGYPGLAYLLGRIRGRPNLRREIRPRVSLLVPAYNEGRAIEAKIDNCARLDYPRDRLEVLVASDGSTDATAEAIEKATKAGLIHGVVFPERRGKAAVLNDLVDRASGEILVVSDATSMLERGSLRALVSNFADPRVGCVSGIYRIHERDRDGKAGPEALYWRYETFIRHSESRLGRMLGAHGSMFGIRRELFERLEPGTRNEDFLLPVTILMKGYRSVYDTRAVAREDPDEMTGFPRRVSLAAGNFQQLGLLLKRRGWLLQPFLLFQLLSHKVLRLVSPFLLLATYASSAWLLASPGYRLAFAAQTVFFLAALSGMSARLRRRGRALIAAPYYFCMVNVAGLVALHRVVSRNGLPGHKAGVGPRGDVHANKA